MTAVAVELRRLYDEHGHLNARLVVDESRDEAAPLHGSFEWDDAVAGEAFRCVQAGKLIRSVRVQIHRHDGEPTTVRGFVNIPGSEPEADDEDVQSGYVPQEIVGSSVELSRIALREMERRWKYLRRAYAEFAEFWTMVEKDAQQAA